METKKTEKRDGNMFVTMDREIIKKLRFKKAESGKAMGRIIEDILKKHFAKERR